MGRAHGDLKYPNLRVRMGTEPGEVEGLEVIDFGCSAMFQGDFSLTYKSSHVLNHHIIPPEFQS